jgi:phage-related minor tail protein
MEIGKSVEDGVVQGLTDAVMGTRSLAEAATGVLNNLKRKLVEVAMQRAVSGLGNAVGGFLGNVFGGGRKRGGGGIGGFLGGLFGRRASGGPVSAGGAFLVGERGPEILQMGSKGGNIIPNNKIGGGTVNNITINVDSSGMDAQGSAEQGSRQLGELIASVVQSTIVQEQRSGGLLNP